MNISRVAPSDSLGAICAQVTPDFWAKDNEMTQYDESSLREFLEDDKNLLMLAWDNEKIAGIALCYEQKHPNGNEKTIYIHELDTHPDYRRQGVATKLMNAVFEEARKRGLSEVWVAADKDNSAANAFYHSLKPNDVDPTITYTYKV